MFIPLIGIFIIYTMTTYGETVGANGVQQANKIKIIGLSTSIVNLIISLFIFIMFDYSSNQYQFVQEYHQVNTYDVYLGIDGLSIYFVLLTTIIMPIALLSN
ncbi:MAG: hypothetical protein EOP34_00115 [Rickettsiales bacterium]|nr:MAG: hypothetical protein EOP34_00115 [Rickettsiales bacterium]